MMSARYDTKTGELDVHAGSDPLTVYRRLATYLLELSDPQLRQLGAAIGAALERVADRGEDKAVRPAPGETRAAK